MAGRILTRRLLAAALLFLALCGFLGFSRGGGVTSGGGSHTGACDTITGGCPSAHSMSQKLVAAYSGPLFELINPAPVWTGTGYISGTTFTVSSTATGAIANGLALSAAGSGFVPAITPVTYTSGCSGSTCTVNLSQTSGSAGSPLTITAYSVLDVGFQSNGAWDESTWQPFCYGVACLVEKIFNQGSGGSTNDLLAAEVSGGAAVNLNCTASIIVCAPLFVIDTSTDTPMAFTMGSQMGVFADVYSGHGTSGFPAAGTNASVMVDAFNIYASGCCGGVYGFTEPNPNSIIAGGMFALGFATGTGSGGPVNCSSSSVVCFLADTEGNGDPDSPAGWGTYDSGTFLRGVWELQYTSSTNTSSGNFNGAQIWASSPPANPASARETWLRIGSGGDRSWLPAAFSDGLITADVSSHAAAVTKLSNFYAGRSSSICQGSLDLSWFMPNAGFGGAGGGVSSAPATVGNGLSGWGPRPLSDWYTGPILTVQNGGGSGSIQTFSGVGCDIDPAINTFCSGGCLVNTMFNQAWALGVGNAHGNVRQTSVDVSATGSARPSLTLNSLNGQPTLHFSGAQQMCTSVTPLFPVRGTYSVDAAIVARRTGAFTTLQTPLWTDSLLYAGFAAVANTAAFRSGVTATISGVSDSHWHLLDVQSIGSTGGTAFVDGTGTPESFTTIGGISSKYCIGASNGSNFFTGDLAEAVMIYDGTFNGTTNNAPALLTNEEAFWGSLPN